MINNLPKLNRYLKFFEKEKYVSLMLEKSMKIYCKMYFKYRVALKILLEKILIFNQSTKVNVWELKWGQIELKVDPIFMMIV